MWNIFLDAMAFILNYRGLCVLTTSLILLLNKALLLLSFIPLRAICIHSRTIDCMQCGTGEHDHDTGTGKHACVMQVSKRATSWTIAPHMPRLPSLCGLAACHHVCHPCVSDMAIVAATHCITRRNTNQVKISYLEQAQVFWKELG